MSSAHDDDPVVDNPQVELEKDLLVRLLGERALRGLRPTDPANSALFDWMAREASLNQSRISRGHMELAARTFASRAMALIDAQRPSIGLRDAAPQSENQSEPLPLFSSVGQAARRHMAPRIEAAVAAGAGRAIWDEPCDVWIHLPDEIPHGRYLAIPVAGNSMSPLFHGGDLVLVRLGSEYATGDVIVASHTDGGYVVKKVGLLTHDSVELVSLNSEYAPMDVARSELSVLGIVVLRWCSHGARRSISANAER
jgi:SOS-response transcriptional repressor LexA